MLTTSWPAGTPLRSRLPRTSPPWRKWTTPSRQSASAGAKPPSGTPRAGTLLFTRPVNGAATVYVVGTDGELHGFATPKQFKNDGYDPALVVTVTSLGGPESARAPARPAPPAMPGYELRRRHRRFFRDVLRLRRRQGLPRLCAAEPAAFQKVDKAVVLSGRWARLRRTPASLRGRTERTWGVYVSYQGKLYPFKSAGQLDADGYGGTAAVHVPGTAGLAVVWVTPAHDLPSVTGHGGDG